MLERYPELSQTFVTREIEQLLARGHDIEVVHLAAPFVPAASAPVGGRALPDAAAPAGPLLRQGVRWLLRSPLGLLWCVSYLVRRPAMARLRILTQVLAVADLRPASDRIHAHFAGPAATVAMLVARLTGTPWSFTSHAIDIFVRDDDVRTKLRRARPPITVCDYNVRFLADRFGYRGPLPVVPCGVEVPEATRVAGPPERGLLVVVARLVEKKGLDVLLDALTRQEASGVSRCVVIGTGPLEDELRALADSLGVAERVAFLGSQQPDVVDDWMRRAWVVSLPARVAASGDRDSQPVVIKEALAREVPVVATDVAAIADMVDDTTGILVPPESPEALAEALGLAMAWSDTEREELGRAGRQRIVDRFAFDRTIPLLLEAWR